MNFEEYKSKMNKDKKWIPGWDAIDECLERIYGNQKSEHYATEMDARAEMGGDEYLDGCSIYKSKKQQPHSHIITYGMSNLYADEEAFGQEYNGWGYEMTMRIANNGSDDCLWVINLLSNLARYTYKGDNAWFEVGHFINGDATPIKKGSKSKITALIVVEDPELPPVETVHGRLEFLQMVGVTSREILAIAKDRNNMEIILENMRKDNGMFITDMDRKKEYI